MIDEIFGFVFAGYEITSTTVSWALKFSADEPSIQTKLRAAMLDAYTEAKAEARNPNIQEITSKRVPFLRATMEEVLRCSGTAPVVDRQALADTEILGHKIPKGTIITCLVTGTNMVSPGFEIYEKVRSPTSQQTIKEGRDRAWDPEDVTLFGPDRWMVNGDFDPTAGPQMAFGLGTRACYGKRLVYVEMRIFIAVKL
ncbi:hypothetical protein ZTR_02481 [Talaromyces verruculosus]|nr:hypothetical protein ZTR_02481 [Talaromyces verruculosus]